MLQQLDEREMLAELAMNLRYTLNSEKVSPNKLFNKRVEERKINEIFDGNRVKNNEGSSMAERIKAVNDYFRNKGVNK